MNSKMSLVVFVSALILVWNQAFAESEVELFEIDESGVERLIDWQAESLEVEKVMSETEASVDSNFALNALFLNFGSVRVRSTRYRAVRLRTKKQLNNLRIRLTGSHDFRAWSRCPRVLRAGDSCRINVDFRPFRRGPKSGTLRIRSNEFNDTVYLRGYGRDRIRSRRPGDRRRPRR